MRLLLNPDYAHLRDFVLALPDGFEQMPCEGVLRCIRNDVRLIRVEGELMVVKSFARPPVLNRLVYGALRASKAERAYTHALRLAELGIGTPVPVAALNVRRWGVLHRSFFVSQYSDYRPIDQLDSYPNAEAEPLIDALTDFLIRLHDRGVVHHDLNISNILHKRLDDGRYDFQVVDINRMEFHRRLSPNERLANLRKFYCSPAAYFEILGRYADRIEANHESFQLRGMSMQLADKLRRELKVKCQQKFKH